MARQTKYKKGTPEWREKLREAGRLGGAATLANKGPEHFAKIGLKGGNALLKKRGAEHFSRLGSMKKGQGYQFEEGE